MNPIEETDSKEDQEPDSAESCDPRQSPQPPRNQSKSLLNPDRKLE